MSRWRVGKDIGRRDSSIDGSPGEEVADAAIKIGVILGEFGGAVDLFGRAFEAAANVHDAEPVEAGDVAEVLRINPDFFGLDFSRVWHNVRKLYIQFPNTVNRKSSVI